LKLIDDFARNLASGAGAVSDSCKSIHVDAGRGENNTPMSQYTRDIKKGKTPQAKRKTKWPNRQSRFSLPVD
jgi:hypothetical protein